MMNCLKLGGVFRAEFRDTKGRLIGVRTMRNGIPNGARDKVLETMFRSDTQIGTWFMGLIDNASFVALGNTDTMPVHAGWIENTDYTETVRQTWQLDAASLQTLASSTPALFNINAGVTLRGLFVTSSNVKGGVTGILWATGEFDEGSIVLTAGAAVSITYTLLAEDALAPAAPTTFTPALGDGQWWGSDPRVSPDAGTNAFDSFTPSAGNPVAYMFRTRRAGTISKIGHRVGNIVTGTYDVRIEGVDDTNGQNDGVLISAGAIATAHAVTSPGDDNSWQTAVLDTPTAVTAGKLIAVVFAFNSGSHQIQVVDEVLRQSGFPYIMAPGGVVTARVPTIALEYDDGRYNQIPGCYPWSDITSPSWDNADTPDERAIKIKPSRSVKILGFWIDYKALVAGANVDFVLYDTDGIAVLETVSHDGNVEPTPGTTHGTRIFMFTKEHTLTKGLTYRLSVKPTTGNNVRVGLRDVANVLVAAAAPGGADFGLSTRTDAGAWTDIDTQRINAGLYVTEIGD